MEKRVKTYLGNSNNQLTNLNSNFVFCSLHLTRLNLLTLVLLRAHTQIFFIN